MSSVGDWFDLSLDLNLASRKVKVNNWDITVGFVASAAKEEKEEKEIDPSMHVVSLSSSSSSEAAVAIREKVFADPCRYAGKLVCALLH